MLKINTIHSSTSQYILFNLLSI